MYRRPLVPDGFEVPLRLECEDCTLRPLTVDDVVQDYDAVMSSVDRLVGVLDDSGWPRGLTLVDDLVDLGWHQREFTLRHSFAYTVVDPGDTRCLGCVYLYPRDGVPIGDAVDVFLWVRTSEADSGLDGRLEATVRTWLVEAWPFTDVRFPGRDAPLGPRPDTSG